MKELIELSVEVRSKEYEDTADAYYEAANYLEAIKEYRKSIELDPSYAENYYKVGRCYYKLENYKEAIIAYTSAINICPLEEEYYYSRALCYLEIKEYDLVIEDITEAIEVSRESDLVDTKNPSSPICICPKGGVPVPGIVGGFFEPAIMVDISAEPYCFVNMGGMKIDMGMERHQGGRPKASSSQISRWYAHYYIYPIIYLLEIFTDFVCLQETNFDPLWITELDPTGLDDELSAILHPEAFLFNNIAAQSACSVDCVSSTSRGKPIDSLYWCAGCQGTMYPMNGSVNAHIGGIQASLNVAEKITFKLHRQGMAHDSSSSDANKICTKHLAPLMKKSHYRYQLVNPDTSKCAPFGKSTSFFEANKERPIIGEDFGYLLWRKKSCCI